MTNWKEYKVEEFAEVIGGGTPSTKNPDYFGGSIPWITPKDLTNYEKKFIKNGDRNITKEGLNNSSAKLIPKNSILLTSRAPIGYLAIAENDITTNQGFKSIVVNPDIADFNFVYYLIKANIERIKGYGTGTTFAEVSATVVKNLKFNLPDLPTQTAIAEILSSLDDKIELNNKINQELENLAQTLFKQWFIDFEFPNENGKPYKSSGGALVDSELGQIPKGWEVVNFKDTIEKYIDNRGKTPPVISDGIPIVEVKHMSDSSIFPSLKTQKFVSQEVYENWFRAYLEEDDLLMSTVGTIGRLNITPKDEIFAIAQNVLGLRFKKEILTQLYMFCLMRSKLFNDEINSRLIITVQASIKRSDLEKIPVVIPDYSILNNFDIQVRTLFDEISNLTKENQELTNLRDTLLPKLISGELEVADIMAEKA